MNPIMPFMQDKDVFEVYANPDGKIWIDGKQHGREFTGIIMTPEQRLHIIQNVVALHGDEIIEKGSYDGEIPPNQYFHKCRFHANVPGTCSAPAFNIRKHPTSLYTLDDYVEQGILSENQRQIILEGIHNRKNIIAAGGTKSGKTTFLNALLVEISKLHERVCVIEDTQELNVDAIEDCIALRTMPGVTMSDLLRDSLRVTPDRIVVGEVRGAEALALLDAWSTGHGGGCSTVHSNNAKETLTRLENMVARVSMSPQKLTIANAVNMIVYLKYRGFKRSVEEIVEVANKLGYDEKSGREGYLMRKIA